MKRCYCCCCSLQDTCFTCSRIYARFKNIKIGKSRLMLCQRKWMNKKKLMYNVTLLISIYGIWTLSTHKIKAPFCARQTSVECSCFHRRQSLLYIGHMLLFSLRLRACFFNTDLYPPNPVEPWPWMENVMTGRWPLASFQKHAKHESPHMCIIR